MMNYHADKFMFDVNKLTHGQRDATRDNIRRLKNGLRWKWQPVYHMLYMVFVSHNRACCLAAFFLGCFPVILPSSSIQYRALKITQAGKFMGTTWGPPGSCRPQMGPMLAPWTLLSGQVSRCALLWLHFIIGHEESSPMVIKTTWSMENKAKQKIS